MLILQIYLGLKRFLRFREQALPNPALLLFQMVPQSLCRTLNFGRALSVPEFVAQLLEKRVTHFL